VSRFGDGPLTTLRLRVLSDYPPCKAESVAKTGSRHEVRGSWPIGEASRNIGGEVKVMTLAFFAE
jgi:hypothetical protein